MKYFLRDLKPYLFGLPWASEDFPKLRRIPSRVANSLSDAIKELSTNLSGSRIRFQAKTEFLKIEAKLTHTRNMDHFSRFGMRGIDLYIDNLYYTTIFNPKKVRQKINFPKSIRDGTHQFDLYLPLYSGLNLKYIEVQHEIKPPKPFKKSEPVIFYGSSITQGGCASRPGLSYEARLSRVLNLDFVNLGFSGNGKGDLAIAELIAAEPSSLIILDWGVNCIPEEKDRKLFFERYEKFIDIIREKQPKLPIILINFQAFTMETMEDDTGLLMESFRKHIRNVYKKKKSQGDMQIWLLEGYDIIGSGDFDCTVDGTHPNDEGFAKYTEKINLFINQNKILQNLH